MQYDRHVLDDIQLFHTALPKGKRDFREHHHTECELSIIRKGSGNYLISGKEYPFRAGDVFIFGSNEPHCIMEITSEEDFDMLTVKLEPKALWSDASGSATVLLKLFFNRPPNTSNRIEFEKPVLLFIEECLVEMEKELLCRAVGFELQVHMLLYRALLCLLRAYGYSGEEHPHAIQTAKQLSLAMDYIEKNLQTDLTLEEIASVATMSKAYFSTVFKKYNGISPWDYITIKRVELAITLLKTTSYKKLEIAEECGFQSSANFYKAFRKVTGKTPKDFL
ncbi:MAG: AraC family transcriptional regulator [Clostridia bacterium]|nr:AraC family transcriptional regulator [Clostridia bacterium]